LPSGVECQRAKKQKLKTHVGMTRGPARRRVRQKTRVWVPHWTAEVRQGWNKNAVSRALPVVAIIIIVLFVLLYNCIVIIYAGIKMTLSQKCCRGTVQTAVDTTYRRYINKCIYLST